MALGIYYHVHLALLFSMSDAIAATFAMISCITALLFCMGVISVPTP